VVIANAQGSRLDPSTRNGVGAKMGLDATMPLDASEMKFKRIAVPGEGDVDLQAALTVEDPTGWRGLLPS